MMRWLLVVVAVFGFVLGAQAQPPERRLALVIGNDAYRHVDVLQNAGRDGHAVARALAERGFEVVEGYDLDRRAMNKLIGHFIDKLSSGTVALVFYAGHGVQIRGGNYLLPIDLQADTEDDVENDAVELSGVLEKMSRVNDRFNLAIIDACRDNPLRGAGRSIGGSRGLAPAQANGVMVIYSAGLNQEALDRLGKDDADPNGLFTRELLKVMREPGLSIRAAVEKLKLKVMAKAATVGARQTPAVYDEATGDFAFTEAPPTPGSAAPPPAPDPQASIVAPPAPAIPAFDPRQIEMALWNSVKDSKDPAELQEYLRRYPDGIFAGVARNRLAMLAARRPPAPEPSSPPRQEQAAIASPPRSEVPQLSADELYTRGDNERTAGHYEEAMRWYRQAADNGDAAAMYKIGILYAKWSGRAEGLR